MFAAENEIKPNAPQGHWLLQIVDDDPEIHRITELVLGDIIFEDKSIKFLHAYSAAEALEQIQLNDDIALILLDVVMEKDDAGLRVVEKVRRELKNELVRIILRTGQPGQAPEREIIMNYDINDYKEKTELTSQKLFSSVISSLRSYRDLKIIAQSKKGLKHIIESSADLFLPRQLNRFASGVLMQLVSMMGLEEGAILAHSDCFAATEKSDFFKVIAGMGQFQEITEIHSDSNISRNLYTMLNEAVDKKSSFFMDDIYVGYFPTSDCENNLLYFRKIGGFDVLEQELVRTFAINVGIAFENIHLNREILDTQSELLYVLGETVETRSRETGHHVIRISAYADIMAEQLGMSMIERDLLKQAAPLHDIGKIGIEDKILNKPGPLNDEEFEIMKTHARLGYDILKNTRRSIMKAGAIVAHQHHERWDGKGYPQGLKGEEIHIYGRIIAIADVFDALYSKRVYKDAWEVQRIIIYFKKERGRQFDPELVDIVLKEMDKFLKVRDELK
ncbi:MAG: DUF3369 domain-containing protein [Planctomycetes bacterium]|nr:DUF3369 domain-containing protein [Planctomycetota bacterium]